ncbi:hypothetical protein [Streptomyces sp. NPDC001635]
MTTRLRVMAAGDRWLLCCKGHSNHLDPQVAFNRRLSAADRLDVRSER